MWWKKNLVKYQKVSKHCETDCRCYGTARPREIENAMAFLGQIRENGTSRLRGVNKNAMPLLGQARESWTFMAPLGHVELTKMQKFLESKNKNKNENEKQIESKNENPFLFSFSFLFLILFLFYFYSFYF